MERFFFINLIFKITVKKGQNQTTFNINIEEIHNQQKQLTTKTCAIDSPVYPRGTIRTIGITLEDRETWVKPISLASLPMVSSCSRNV